MTPVLNDWVKDCTDVLNFSITSLLFSTAHKYSIGDKLDYKVANWERKIALVEELTTNIVQPRIIFV